MTIDQESTPPVPALTSLEQALSLEPIKSPELEIEIKGVKIKVCFRELSQTRIDRLRTEAIQWVENLRRKNEGKTTEWRDVQYDLDSIRANRLDLLMLHASMVDPRTGGPACALSYLEQDISPEQQEFLASKWNQWKKGLDPDALTPELVDEVLQYLKNGVMEGVDPSALSVYCWTRLGYKRLVACLLTLVARLEPSQTEPSSGG